ncbi:hypothetical protein CARUB_v10007192mg [Capsella rubella]|uniref:Uncharacterized protein n=1 Tax=Capsella rubella TaxID=81985 RepID=R0H513_9BRAS|nr:uncharacterized protein LOC17878051 [Capsella rubella]EOA18618.1 hypothetical protein CARUB_v10007192mg [Capsella rubella]
MKEDNFVSSASDPMIRLKKDLEVKRRKLEMLKQKRSTLKAEVRFLRRRYEHLKPDQTLETSSEVLRLSEPGGSEVPSKPSGQRKKKHSGVRASVKQNSLICNEKEAFGNNASCDLEKKLKRSRDNDILTNSVALPDLNGEGNTSVPNKVPGFDLNQISREEEEPEANGQHMVAGAMKNAMLGNRISDLHDKRQLPICGDVEKKLNRGVKRKVSWQDPVALSV